MIRRFFVVLCVASSPIAKGAATFRWIADLSMAPPPAPFAPMPMRTLELVAKEGGMEATVVAAPRRGAEVAATLRERGMALVAEAAARYQARAGASVEDEIASIAQHHTMLFMPKLLVPKAVTGDRLSFSHPFPNLGMSALVVNSLGMLSAIAIPAFFDYMHKGKTSEAELQLDKIRINGKAMYAMDGAFPTATTALTPAKSCCNYDPHKKCPVTPSDWAPAGWQAFDFQLDEPSYFRYQVTSTPTTIEARAVGDLDCDGVEIEYTLRGTIENGNPVFTLTKPPPNDD